MYASINPIDSYQDARDVSYVVLTRSTSPFIRPTRHDSGVLVIARSHDTGPFGSKYFAFDRNKWARLLRRCTARSTCSPPGWRCPAAATRVPGRSTFHSFSLG